MMVAMVALVVSLGGTGYAATRLPRNSVGAAQIRRSAVTSAKVRKNAIPPRRSRTVRAWRRTSGRGSSRPAGPGHKALRVSAAPQAASGPTPACSWRSASPISYPSTRATRSPSAQCPASQPETSASKCKASRPSSSRQDFRNWRARPCRRGHGLCRRDGRQLRCCHRGRSQDLRTHRRTDGLALLAHRALTASTGSDDRRARTGAQTLRAAIDERLLGPR
jgi:hypothetical protein